MTRLSISKQFRIAKAFTESSGTCLGVSRVIATVVRSCRQPDLSIELAGLREKVIWMFCPLNSSSRESLQTLSYATLRGCSNRRKKGRSIVTLTVGKHPHDGKRFALLDGSWRSIEVLPTYCILHSRFFASKGAKQVDTRLNTSLYWCVTR